MIDEPSRAVLAAFFFVAGRDEYHVAIEQDSRPLDREHRHQLDHARALVVERAAPPDFSVFHRPRERRNFPFLRIGGHHVHVAEQNYRLGMFADPAQPRRDDPAAMLRLPGGRRDSVGKKFLLEHPRRADLVARRVGRVDLDVLRQQVGRFLGDLVPVDWLRRRRFGHSSRFEVLKARRSARSEWRPPTCRIRLSKRRNKMPQCDRGHHSVQPEGIGLSELHRSINYTNNRQ